MRRLATAVLAATTLFVVPLGLLAAPAGAARSPRAAACRPACRVLVLALPAVSWAELERAVTPNLHALLAGSAVAALSTRAVHQRTSPGDGYATIGAGTRTVAEAVVAGQAFEGREAFGSGSAAEVFARRFGRPLGDAIGVMGFARVTDANAALPYDAKPGLLGETLAQHGIARAVVGNADDGELEATPDGFHRELALGLVDRGGRVPGTVGPELLVTDPSAPFGVRLDEEAVLRAFRSRWQTGRRVVLVEASDLARADAYRAVASAGQRRALLAAALARTDALVGRVMRSVDPRHDAVLTVAPYHSSAGRELTVMALRAPGSPTGVLRSATTRRAGFVQIADVAPTILSVLGVSQPETMEGRPAEVVADGASLVARISPLVRENEAAQFRDAVTGRAGTVLVVSTVVFAIGAVLVPRRSRFGRVGIPLAALALIGLVLGTFALGPLPFHRWGQGAYWLALGGFAAAFAVACRLAGARRAAGLGPLLVALGLVVSVHVADVLTGARLELDSAFGYSPTVGVRLAGLGNLGSADLCAAALLLAALVGTRDGAPARRGAIGLLGVVAVVVASPVWGQDFGGALSAAPAFVLLALLLLGRRLRARTVALLGAALVGAGLLAGFADLARPAGQQTHIGRFFAKVGREGVSGFTTVVSRKAHVMLDTFTSPVWMLLLVVALGAIAYAATDAARRRELEARLPRLRGSLAAFAVLIVLATALNDSGATVAGMMLAVLVPALAWLSAWAASEPGPKLVELSPRIAAPPRSRARA